MVCAYPLNKREKQSLQIAFYYFILNTLFARLETREPSNYEIDEN